MITAEQFAKDHAGETVEIFIAGGAKCRAVVVGWDIDQVVLEDLDKTRTGGQPLGSGQAVHPPSGGRLLWRDVQHITLLQSPFATVPNSATCVVRLPPGSLQVLGGAPTTSKAAMKTMIDDLMKELEAFNASPKQTAKDPHYPHTCDRCKGKCYISARWVDCPAGCYQ
jgi:hypothetical protein